MIEKEKEKKQLNSIGDNSRKQIYDFIVKHTSLDYTPGRKGVKSGEISKHVYFKEKPISRETTALHLRELKKQKKIYKRDGRYFASDLELGIMRNFGQCMSMTCSSILRNILNPMPRNKIFRTTIGGKPDPSFIELSKAISGNAVSKKYCRTSFDKNSLNEKYLFEFANRIGAYIIYIFIASAQIPLKELSESEEYKKNDSDRRIKILCSELIHKSMDFEFLFENFLDLFNSVNSLNFDTLIETFRGVYPGIYKGLKNEWCNEVADHSNLVESSEQYGLHCDHIWEKISIIMLPGKYYFCRKCSHLADERYMNMVMGRTR